MDSILFFFVSDNLAGWILMNTLITLMLLAAFAAWTAAMYLGQEWLAQWQTRRARRAKFNPAWFIISVFIAWFLTWVTPGIYAVCLLVYIWLPI